MFFLLNIKNNKKYYHLKITIYYKKRTMELLINTWDGSLDWKNQVLKPVVEDTLRLSEEEGTLENVKDAIAKISQSQDERNQNTARQEVYIYCKNYLKNYFKKCQK